MRNMWCKNEMMYLEELTALHGPRHLEDCLWAVIEKYEDGYILCPILDTGGKCEECYEAFGRSLEREEG